jgi:hypothetical protein
MNAMPFLRFDPRQPRMPYHQFQHIYMVSGEHYNTAQMIVTLNP